MPAGFYTPSSEIEPVVGIQICVFSPDEIERRSVVEITNGGTYEGNEPKIGGLFDPRMGVLDNGKECRSCGQTNHKCPGHFGHFRLARPVYYIQFLPFIQNVLSCVCIRCSKLLVDKKFRKHFLKRKGEARWRDVLTASKEIKRCGQETEDGCGARQPTRYLREGIARIVAEWDDVDGGAAAPQATKQRQPLEVEYVLRLFRRILDDDVDFIGLNRFWCRPDWMICTVLPIPPPQVRPSVIQDNNQRSEDDLTHKLAEIIKTNNTYLLPRIQGNAAKSVIDEWTNVLQYHIATLVDNQIPGVAPSAQRNGRPLKSIQQRLGSKEGRIRYNIQGKRVEFSARSVITPDPNISIAELGVPEKIAMNLTRPERVTEFNLKRLYKFIQNGPNKFPGAKTIRRADGRIISLRHVNTKEVQLHYGDIVNRHLMDGDIVLFNRQPTLHRMSMMGHRVKVLKYKTFRLNVSVTAPYNADFDGDEMNMHCPQSYEAATELEEIAAVPHQILRPRDGIPVIGVVQDTLVGSYRLTRDHVKFNRREFMNLMMWNKRFDGEVPAGAKEGSWSGHQVLSQLMPPINMEMTNSSKKKVVITEGEVKEGQFDKSVFSKASKGIIHMTFNDYGSKQTVDFIDAMQNTIEQFLVYNGFSVGISDLIADSTTKADMNAKIQEKKSDVETILLSVHQDLFDNNTGKSNQAEFEDRIFGIFNKATELAGDIGYNSLANENRMTAMVRAGSKGGPINIAQMIACLGQQNIDGKRIPYGFEDRTLPHFKKYDDGAEARGFIENSFINGLTPTEFFFHAMSGREGLIDTAVKSVSGDTKIIVIENGVSKCVAIGDWVDAHLAGNEKDTEFFEADNNLEILQLASDTYIPTVTPEGKVSWGKVAAVTRHDPGQKLFEVKTLGGRSVIVPESKSLLVWDSASKTFNKMDTPSVRPGHCMPVTMKLSNPPVICESISLSNYLPKSSYIYGTDFQAAEVAVNEAMLEREHIPSGWWANANGKSFTLPYDSKARFVRTLSRSKTDNILPGYVYPFTTNRDHARIPESFTLDSDNGRFLGLFLAEGNVDVKSEYIAITNNNPHITQFVHDWFENQRVRTSEDVKLNAIGGVTTTVRGYSTLLAKFFDLLGGHGAANKRVPAEAFAAPTSFIVGLLDGYFSGDGTVSTNSVEAGSASKELIEGISMLCSRLGIFAKVFESQLTSNNIGTENILPTYRISIRAQWAAAFAKSVTLIDDAKNTKLMNLKASLEHRNFPSQNDVVLDEIVEINPVSLDAYPKLYDLTVPETFTFGLANGLQVYDTADTGYIQRQLVKAMEDLVVQHDGTVRDANMNITQFHYGEDGINSTKIESQSLEMSKFSDADIRREFGLEGADLTSVLAEGVDRDDDAQLLKTFADSVKSDQKMVVEGVFRSGSQGGIFAAVNLERLLLTIKTKFGLNSSQRTNLTPRRVIAGIEAVLEKTQRFHKMWAALLRYHLSPMKLIVKERFTESAFDSLCEMLVTKNWQAWVQPGEQVGIIAAQSIGEPSTQMTLNTFHLAGVASKSNVTRGVPRLKELLKVTQNPKAISLTIPLKKEYSNSKAKAREVAQELELTLLRDMTIKTAIYYDPKDSATVLKEDRELLAFYKMFELSEQEENWSKYILRLEFNRQNMFDKNITMDDILFVLRRRFEDEIQLIYSDFNSQKLVMRIRMSQESLGLEETKTGPSSLDALSAYKKFQNKLLNSVIIRGVPGIKAVTFRKGSERLTYNEADGKYETKEEYILDTDGSNFLEVMNHPAVDATRVTSTHVHDIYSQLGIEATRHTLYTEITTLFEEGQINYRHLGLLVDVMTRAGRLMSVDRYGINKLDIGPLAKASFEETERILLKAAVFGEIDPVTGVSANIMTGQPIRGGTAFSDILLDEVALLRLQKGLPPSMPLKGEAPAPVEEVVEQDPNDMCSATRLKMNLTLPTTTVNLTDEPDIEFTELVDE
jgi:DNA-directed RNA polymerase beta' subunit/intein/homing endonuclease